MLPPHRFRPLSISLFLFAISLTSSSAFAQDAPDPIDSKIIAEAKTGCEAIKNLTYLCDEIGPRLTGSKNLQRANLWAAKRMQDYGLTNVHQEPWEIPEGWVRGIAEGRVIEPDTGVRLCLASYGWFPGTKGKIQAPVVALEATSIKELGKYKGKLKGAIVLSKPPTKLVPEADLDKPLPAARPASSEKADAAPAAPMRSVEVERQYIKDLAEFLIAEGAAAVFVDSGKHYGLLNTTGTWTVEKGMDRPSASNRMPQLFVAHNHYEMLYRLATRKSGEPVRIELEVANEFIPGPISVNNTVGEIIGSEKPDEFVVCGAHLDSWDLGQGATDNGTGSIVCLEAARLLAKSGIKPKRTIRFVLFSGEEQGLHGSKAYVERHKEEMPRVSACLIDDTGTGRIVGIDAKHRPVLQPLLAKELAGLKDLGLKTFDTAFIAGSDHASFDKAGVPGLMFRQEIAGYRLTHHSQIDTPDRAVEANLIQAAEIMAATAVHIANRDALLPRDKPEEKKGEAKKEMSEPKKG